MAGTETRRLKLTTTFRLSAEEAELLRVAAERRDLGPSAFARQVVLAALGRRVRPRKIPRLDAQALARILGELGRIGSLANQLARVANATGETAPAEAVAALRVELESLTRAVLAAREEAGG